MTTPGRQRRGAATAARREEDLTDQVTNQETDRETARTVIQERLRRAIAAGDYDRLLDPAFWRLLDSAAGTTSFDREIGALRFAMVRLLAEEEDPRHLATQLARVTATIVRTAQAQRHTTQNEVDPVRAALLTGLDDLDGDGDALAGLDDGEQAANGEDDGWSA